MVRKTRRRRKTETEAELELFERGWRPAPGGTWRHPNIELAWPTVDAIRLQDEADAGMQDAVHRMLRGDD